jgi:hypothetical protein
VGTFRAYPDASVSEIIERFVLVCGSENDFGIFPFGDLEARGWLGQTVTKRRPLQEFVSLLEALNILQFPRFEPLKQPCNFEQKLAKEYHVTRRTQNVTRRAVLTGLNILTCT